MALAAILWDYDGTLVDSTKKNMAVTIEILKEFIPGIQHKLPAVLTFPEEYRRANYQFKDWREMYRECYNLSETQIDEAGELWSMFQIKNQLIPDIFTGLDDLIKTFGDIKHGICSRNSAATIHSDLDKLGIASYFKAIIGYEEVPWTEQKPNPAGFLKCLKLLNIDLENSTIFYVGDHQEDVTFGKNAETLLKQQGFQVAVKCIAVDYSGSKPFNWSLKPDIIASSVLDLQKIIEREGFR